MKWISEWRALSKQIDRLREAAEFIVHCDKNIGLTESSRAIKKIWLPAIESTADNLLSFVHRYHRFIYPDNPDERLRHMGTHSAIFRMPDRQLGNLIQEMQFRLSFLLAKQASLDHLIGDFEFFARRTVERAFIHLQRTLIVDDKVKTCWNDEFTKREEALEKLGAVHLLGHGIWAFKVGAIGERTDLVLGEPLKNVQDDVYKAAEVLALTEWKKINDHTDKNEIKKKIKGALQQVKLYSTGSLAGIELEKCRYLVLVSQGRIILPLKDIEEKNIIYRHINIAIAPVTPSRERQ